VSALFSYHLNRKWVVNNVHLDLSPKEINLRLLGFTMIWELGILLIFLKLRHELSTIATAFMHLFVDLFTGSSLIYLLVLLTASD
jgi:hypothetical protein